MHLKLYFSHPHRSYLLILLFCFTRQISADVVLDGSLSTANPILNSPNYVIEQEYGKQKGSNLFHSFSQFSLDKGESATFKANSQIQNIVSRVTGGETSFINGTIASETANQANLWLINPAGWIFGEHAQLNVQGSFNVSTADAVTLKDGNRFYADPGLSSGLSIAGPLGYEFTQPSHALITIDRASLKLQEGKTMSFVGGDININDTQLKSQSGQILIASNASPGTWEVSDNGLENSGQLLGNIRVSQASESFADASFDISPDLTEFDPDQTNSQGGGLIQLVAADTTLEGTQILAFSVGDAPGGTIQLDNSGTLSFLDESIIRTGVIDSGTGGTIMINAGNLILKEGSQIRSDLNFSSSNGTGGQILVQVTDNLVLSGNDVQIISLSQGTGEGGDIDIKANSIAINDLAAIVTDTAHGADAGAIKVVAHSINLESGGTISSSSSDLAIIPPNTINAGKGGDIYIQTSSLNLTDEGTLIASSSFSADGVGVVGGGVGGNISMHTDNLTVANHAQVQADSSSKSAAGTINVINSGLLEIDNALFNTQANAADGGQISIQTETLALRNGQVTSSVEGSQGNGGNISIASENLVMNTGFIQANTTTVGGLGGEIVVDSNILLASSNNLIVGGDERLDYQENSGINVIQAAAPDGISGEVNVNTVQLDISGELANVDSKFSKPKHIADNPCLVARGIVPSSLVVTGRGALPVSASDSTSVSFIDYLNATEDIQETVGEELQLSNLGSTSPCS